MNYKSLISVFSLLFISASSFAADTSNPKTLNIVCGVSVMANGFDMPKCEALPMQLIEGGAAFGGYGLSIKVPVDADREVYGMAFITNPGIEQNITLSNKSNNDRVSSTSLHTSIGSMTVLELKDATVRMRCIESTSTLDQAKKEICGNL